MKLWEYIKDSSLTGGRREAGVKSVCALLLLFSALVYLNSSYNTYHLDDLGTVSGNPYIRSLENIPTFFTNPETFSGTGHSMYRPMLLVTFALNYYLDGENVLGYHLVSIAIHSLNTVLLFFLLYQVIQVSRGRKSQLPEVDTTILYASFWAALLFGVHTVNTQAVNYISSRSVLLVTFFFLIAFNLYIRSSGRPILYLLSFVFYGLSALSKESAVTFPVMIFAYSLLFEVPRRRAAILRVLPFILVNMAGIVAVIGVYGLERVALTRETFFEGKGLARAPWSNLLTQAVVLFHYLRLFVLPAGLAVVYDFTIYETIKSPAVIFSISTILASLAGGFALLKNQRAITFGILWLLIALIPETIIPLNMVVNEHRTYLPFTGFSLITAGILIYILEGSPLKPYALTLLLSVLTLAMGVNTVYRNRVWESKISLLEDNLLKAPGSNLVNDTLIEAYLDAGETDKATELIKRSMELNPSSPSHYFALGEIALEVGDFTGAISNLKIALSMKPGSSPTLNMLGVTLLNSGKARESLEMFMDAKKFRPVWDEIYYNMGRAYFELQEYDSALENFERSLELNPEYFEAYNNVGLVNMARGNYQPALDNFGEALRLRPDDLLVLNNMAITYLETKEFKMALSILDKISTLDPLFVDGINTFGEYYLKRGEFERALESFERALSIRGFPVGYWNAAVAAEKSGDISGAIGHWRSFLGNYPGSPEEERVWAQLENLQKRLNN